MLATCGRTDTMHYRNSFAVLKKNDAGKGTKKTFIVYFSFTASQRRMQYALHERARNVSFIEQKIRKKTHTTSINLYSKTIFSCYKKINTYIYIIKNQSCLYKMI